MKKILTILSTVTLSTAAVVPIINGFVYAPSQSYKMSYSYSYNLRNLDWNNIDFKEENGIKKATLTSPEFTQSLKDTVEQMFNDIKESGYTEYEVIDIRSDYSNHGQSNLYGDLETFNELFSSANLDINDLNIQSQNLIIEQFDDPSSGVSYYENIEAIINNQKVKLYAYRNPKPINNLETLKSNFKNTFTLEVIKEVWIDGEDSKYWQLQLPQNIEFQYVDQIIGWFMNSENANIRNSVIEHINNEKNVKLTKFDRPERLYKAIWDENLKTYIAGEQYASNAVVKEEYFYIGITSKEEANGEYKVIVKNTLGTKGEE
ncbi:hypothetical protein [Spiroplasma diminutum]|uniref:Uncharacterized protein n=1 Tax=Spiroplasma diminutum CUAS-1 TaxID=1276221 RepID=S5M2U2_9MOLU|nr:hypothetical protein [Spiroplasma diminutum]AGR42402.1 hypothetical protein SDIMI_v3c06980 [Spiroplasma diminutum CUAS-1]